VEGKGGGVHNEWLEDKCECFMKAYYPGEKNLEYEQKIYKYLSERTNEYLHSAFILPIRLIENYTFPQIPKEITEEKTKDEINMIIANKAPINIIITKTYSNMKSLFDTLKEIKIKKSKEQISRDIMTPILFQVLYAIYYMHTELELVHHDLRLSNILVKEYKTPQTIKYSYLNKEYTIKTCYRIYMDNFDSGFTPSLGDNEFINDVSYIKDGIIIRNKSYSENGIINKITNYDVYCFLLHILDFIESEQMEEYFYTKKEIIKRLYLHSNLVKKKEYIWEKYCKLLPDGKCDTNLSKIEEDYDIKAYLKDIIRYMTINKLITLNGNKNKYLKYKTKYLQLKKEFLQLK
jgi:hypothetical protein